MSFPRLLIDRKKIFENSKLINDRCLERDISVVGVSKSVLGCPEIVGMFIKAGIKRIGDSRIENLVRLKENFGDSIVLMCLRTPMLSQLETVIKNCDTSMNTEKETAVMTDRIAISEDKDHSIIVMIETDDRREGILPGQLIDHCRFIKQRCRRLRIAGIGTNARCISSRAPRIKSIRLLCELKGRLEDELDIRLKNVSGGNSSVWDLIENDKMPSCVNEVRIGEAILLGNETAEYKKITGAHQDAFRLDAEIIELKQKKARPYKLILALGLQDVNIKDIKCYNPNLSAVEQSSDHTVMKIDKGKYYRGLEVGTTVSFIPDYFGLLSLMTSPFVKKVFLDS